MSDGGKGSSPRPFSVSNDEYSKRWDAIFGKDKPCEHQVWTVNPDGLYVCLNCGVKSDAGPYVSK